MKPSEVKFQTEMALSELERKELLLKEILGEKKSQRIRWNLWLGLTMMALGFWNSWDQSAHLITIFGGIFFVISELEMKTQARLNAMARYLQNGK